MNRRALRPLMVGIILSASTRSASAQQQVLVDLSLLPPVQNAKVGDTIHVPLIAIAQMEPGKLISDVEVVLLWDPGVLRLLGRTSIEDYDWLVETFPPQGSFDVDGLNITWTDGDAYYIALAQFPPRPFPFITVLGLHVTTFNFQVLAEAEYTTIYLSPESPKPDGELATVVYDGTIPNFPVTGELDTAEVRSVSLFGDFDLDGAVEVKDVPEMGACLLGPGEGTSRECAIGDFQKDDDVDLADYARFANAYTAP